MSFRLTPVGTDIIQLRFASSQWPAPANIYLIRDGDSAAVIDTGLGTDEPFAAMVVAMADGLSRWGLALAQITTILLTHTHVDHAGGALRLARLTGARVIFPERGWSQAADPFWQVHHIFPDDVRQELDEHANLAVADHFRETCMPDLFTDAEALSWWRLTEGDQVEIGRYRFIALHTPGHDVGHLAFFDPAERVSLTGDLLGAAGTALPWYPPNAGGIEAYFASLERLLGLDIETACPGHGKVVIGSDSVREAIRSTMQTILSRDRSIITCLLERPASFETLDDQIYPGLVRKVIPWASSVTRAHLSRLERMGIVARHSDGPFLVEPIQAARFLEALDSAMEEEVPTCRL